MWDVTWDLQKSLIAEIISTHTSRVGCDSGRPYKVADAISFLLTHPVWDVTAVAGRTGGNHKFLLTHPVWDVTRMSQAEFDKMMISTHTSRVGCDGRGGAGTGIHTNFYSHIPCGM